MKVWPLFALLALLTALYGCSERITPPPPAAAAEAAATPAQAAPFGTGVNGLDAYWYQGKAEISRYELRQNRYQDVHPGEAILIQVNEDFLTDLQVKNDYNRNPNSINVFKTNLIRRFTTGLYDYSIMASVFTPVATAQNPYTLKVTTSVQDWCGQVFGQLNFRNGGYAHQLHSYFEGEADKETQLPAMLLEDELFNRIRMDWRSLPTGAHVMLPSLAYLRLLHKNEQPYEVNLTLADYTGADITAQTPLKVYRVEFPELNRRLEIVFSAQAPYYIEGWIDVYPSSFDREPRTTVARRTHTILDTYWNQNQADKVGRRNELGLPTF